MLAYVEPIEAVTPYFHTNVSEPGIRQQIHFYKLKRQILETEAMNGL